MPKLKVVFEPMERKEVIIEISDRDADSNEFIWSEIDTIMRNNIKHTYEIIDNENGGM